MLNLLHDCRYALRMLVRRPGFTAVAVITLALGLGANLAIFTLLYNVVLRPLPYTDSNRLTSVFLMVRETPGQPPDRMPWSYPKFEDFRRQSTSFEPLAAYTADSLNLTGGGDAERVQGEYVSASYFPTLRVPAARGRLFLPEEDQIPGRNPVALLSDGLWRRRFGADPDMIGKTIVLNQTALTVVGVLPAGFRGETGQAEVWTPMMMVPALTASPRRLQYRMAHWHQVIGRLKPGISLERANAEAQTIVAAMEKENPSARGSDGPPWTGGVIRLAEAKTDRAIRKSLLVLLAAVTSVLLIACLNLANLLLGKAVERRREVAVRLALGATRMQLIRQFLLESMMLSLLGGFVGWLLAVWSMDLLAYLQPEAARGFWVSYLQSVTPDSLQVGTPVVLFGLLLSIVTGALFGIAPAFHACRVSINQALKGGVPAPFVTPGRRHVHAGTATAPRFRRLTGRNAMIAVQMAIALVLLAGAGLLVRSFARLLDTDLGVQTSRLLTFRVDLPRQKYDPAAAVAFERELNARIRSLPAVEAVAVTDSLPVRGQSSVVLLQIEGREDHVLAGVHSVSPDFFTAFRIPLLRGRLLSEQDHGSSPHVAVINQTAARALFPGRNPIGQRLSLSIDGLMKDDDRPAIVGIAGDVKYEGVAESTGNDVYVSYLQQPVGSAFYAVRTAGDPAALVAALREQVKALDRELPMFGVKTMEQHVADATSRTRFSAVLLSLFAGLALVLAAVGLYGVVSYSVASRTREIGIRMALGARRADVLRMVVGDGLTISIAGLAIGLPAALVATRVLASMLYGVRPWDALTFAAVCALLAAAGIAAAAIPARRAARVEPMTALRCE